MCRGISPVEAVGPLTPIDSVLLYVTDPVLTFIVINCYQCDMVIPKNKKYRKDIFFKTSH